MHRSAGGKNKKGEGGLLLSRAEQSRVCGRGVVSHLASATLMKPKLLRTNVKERGNKKKKKNPLYSFLWKKMLEKEIRQKLASDK